MGSTALGICYVGAGWADIYTVITGIDMWDVAAAYLVAREAGAVVCDVTGRVKIPASSCLLRNSSHFSFIV